MSLVQKLVGYFSTKENGDLLKKHTNFVETNNT